MPSISLAKYSLQNDRVTEEPAATAVVGQSAGGRLVQSGTCDTIGRTCAGDRETIRGLREDERHATGGSSVVSVGIN